MIIGAFGYLLENNNVMFILRKNNPYANTWSLPGGAIEAGESIEDTVFREFEEETDLKVKVGEKIGEQLFEFKGKQFLAHICQVQYASGDIKIGEDVLDVKYFSKKEMNSITIAPPIREFFNRYNLWPRQ